MDLLIKRKGLIISLVCYYSENGRNKSLVWKTKRKQAQRNVKGNNFRFSRKLDNTKMAGVNDCFTVGSIVACKTCFSKEIEGEVLAFDSQTKMLILKCPSSNGRASLSDIFVVNLALVSDVQVKKEVTTVSESPNSLNLHRLNTRIRNQVEEKKRLVNALNAGVSPEGQKLFLAISKTISEVSWSGVNIMVWNKVVITPPYKAENLQGDPDCKALPHIKKIVEKHIKDSLYQGN